jgi:probable rRNA maturation factor
MSSDDPHRIEILIDDRQDVPIDQDALVALAHRSLTGEGVKQGELSVSFVTIEEMEELHVRFLGEPGPTDVLSFPQDGDPMLGDVVICPAYAADTNDDLESELRLLLVHGILHLLGYDHEEDTDRAQMWARQEHYVEAVS